MAHKYLCPLGKKRCHNCKGGDGVEITCSYYSSRGMTDRPDKVKNLKRCPEM